MKGDLPSPSGGFSDIPAFVQCSAASLLRDTVWLSFHLPSSGPLEISLYCVLEFWQLRVSSRVSFRGPQTRLRFWCQIQCHCRVQRHADRCPRSRSCPLLVYVWAWPPELTALCGIVLFTGRSLVLLAHFLERLCPFHVEQSWPPC